MVFKAINMDEFIEEWVEKRGVQDSALGQFYG